MKNQVAPCPETGLPRWPDQIRRLAGELRDASDSQARGRARSELWLLLCVVLPRLVRTARGRAATSVEDDVRDAMADKARDLLARIESGAWNPGRLTAVELRNFLATAARHTLVDHLRRRMREVPVSPELLDRRNRSMSAASPGTASDAAEHARAIVGCCSALTPRARLIWFLRVLLELSSADIASHPEVRSTGPAVDSMLLRCRNHLKTCLEAHGLGGDGFPVGTFSALYDLVLGEAKIPGAAAEAGVER